MHSLLLLLTLFFFVYFIPYKLDDINVILRNISNLYLKYANEMKKKQKINKISIEDYEKISM